MQLPNYRISASLSLALLLMLAACGNGPHVRGSGKLTQEARETPDFAVLQVENGIEARVVVDPTQPKSVRVVGDDNLVPLVQTLAEGERTLRVYFRPEDVGTWTSSNLLRVEATVPSLEALTRSGGGMVDLSGTVSHAGFRLEGSGGGTVWVRGLATEALSLEMSGGTDVSLAGRVARLTSNLSGGSSLGARDLSTWEATLTLSGGGSTVVRVLETLRVTASGGGEVRIVGRPAVVSQELSGGSTLVFE